jgi:hypothetical protein
MPIPETMQIIRSGRPRLQTAAILPCLPASKIENEPYYFFESSLWKWLSTSSRLSGFPALVKTTE